MLKITKRFKGTSAILKLEGVLREAWLDEVRTAFENLNHGTPRRSLDLSDVTFADGAGIALLKELIAQGARIEACSGFIAATLGLETP